ncbi:MAG: serine/threonine protein kinase [Planctomycetaceae bacterium]|jgi:serine/threonine protein kinase
MLTTCYSREQLEGYLSGELADPLSDQIEDHVADCSACEDSLSELDASDNTLIRTLRLKSGAAADDSPGWVERVAGSPFEVPVDEQAVDEKAESPSRLGDYELQNVIGRGGMSVVFSARHTHLGRDVALKVLLPTHQQHGISRDRFAREMRAVGALDHPAIVRATDAGQYRNTSYLVMEKIDGVDLTRVFRKLGPLSVPDACQIVAEAARGLAYAHEKGVVHRDIKPSNLIINDQGAVKILDFGLARVQSVVGEVSMQTTVGQLLGTLDYMAPEQADGSDVDDRADIYALGATLFKLLGGSPPHGRSVDVPILEHLNRLAGTEAPRLTEFRDDIPEELVELIADMLRKDPSERLASATEVADRLAAFTDGADLQALRDQTYSPDDGDSGEQSAENMRADMEQIWPVIRSEGNDVPDAAPAADSGHSNGRSSFGSRVAAAMIGVIATTLLGVVIFLQTDHGEIRIDSTIDDIQVSVVKDDKVFDSFVVKQGKNVFEVRTGKYEIRIASPSDGIEVSPQRVTVVRGDLTIATIQKTAKPAAKPVATIDRASEVSKQLEMLTLQMNLSEANRKLAEAQTKFGPESPEVSQLNQEVTRIQALSRPIPSEPVYEGRTLSDWLAQMRFEQQTDAKRHAAEGVSELSETRPAAAGLEIALEAGEVLVETALPKDPNRARREIDETLQTILSNHDKPFSTYSQSILEIPVRLLQKLDRSAATNYLVKMLSSEEPTRRVYALYLLASMHQQLAARSDGWDSVFRELDRLAMTADTVTRARALTVLAACVPDKGKAVKALTDAQAGDASYVTLVCWFLIERDRELEVPQASQLDWLGEVLLKLPLGSDEYLNALIVDPVLGPLLGVNWNEPTSQQRDVASAAVEKLVMVLHKESARTDRSTPLRDQMISGYSSSLCRVIDLVSLSPPVKDAALTALNLRLKRLLEFRDRFESSTLGWLVDTPSQVAVAITLLSGHTPKSLKDATPRDDQESPELHKLSEMATDPQPQFRSSAPRAYTTSSPMFEWYPYHALQTFAGLDALRLAKGTSRSKPLSGSTLIGMYAQSHRIVVHPVLAVDYIANLTATDATSTAIVKTFSTSLAQPKQLLNYVQRHPAFAERVSAWADRSVTHESIDASVRILEAAQPADVLMERMHEWLSSDDEQRAQYAVDKFWKPDFVDDRKKWGRDIAATIARLSAEKEFFEPQDIQYLDDLGEDAEPAIDELVRFVDAHLPISEDALNKTNKTVAMVSQGTHLQLKSNTVPYKVLSRFPAKSKVLRSDVEETLIFGSKNSKFKLADSYEAALIDFLKALDAAEPESAP